MKQCELPSAPYSLSAPIPPFSKIVCLGYLITAIGKKYEQQNQSKDAMQSYLNGIQFGKDMGQKNQSLISRRNGAGTIVNNTQPFIQLIQSKKLSGVDYRQIITTVQLKLG